MEKKPTKPRKKQNNKTNSTQNAVELDPKALENAIYQIWWRWSDFEIIVSSPKITEFTSPIRIEPETVAGQDEPEFVYPILDFGNKLSTSKQTELLSAGLSMCKMYYTIEKIIDILIQRLQKEGIAPETEVQVMLNGHEITKRKAFESIINLDHNVVVANFDPGAWGEKYLRVVKRLGEQGYGYPTKAPRDIYKRPPKISRMSKTNT